MNKNYYRLIDIRKYAEFFLLMLTETGLPIRLFQHFQSDEALIHANFLYMFLRKTEKQEEKPPHF